MVEALNISDIVKQIKQELTIRGRRASERALNGRNFSGIIGMPYLLTDGADYYNGRDVTYTTGFLCDPIQPNNKLLIVTYLQEVADRLIRAEHRQQQMIVSGVLNLNPWQTYELKVTSASYAPA